MANETTLELYNNCRNIMYLNFLQYHAPYIIFSAENPSLKVTAYCNLTKVSMLNHARYELPVFDKIKESVWELVQITNKTGNLPVTMNVNEKWFELYGNV
jgi:hypothetical protein